MKKFTVVGIDLAGSEKRNTGICSLKEKTIISFATLHANKEILTYVKNAQPDLIAIDAPLNLPPGRKSLDDKNGEHFRPCDRELQKRGIRFFPITLGPMRSLTQRGIDLKKKFSRLGFDVVEIYPGASQDVWNIPRKQMGLDKLRNGLKKLGIVGLKKEMNGDELDAITGAITGLYYLQNKAEVLGNFKNGAIVIPK